MAIVKKEVKKIIFVAGRPVDTTKDKCPKQMQVILDVLKEAGTEGLERSVLIEKITPLLVTKQTPERILAFYAPYMTTSGLAEKLEKIEIVEVEVADKPKVEKKTANPGEGENAGEAQAPKAKSVRGKKGKVAEVAIEVETSEPTGETTEVADAAVEEAA